MKFAIISDMHVSTPDTGYKNNVQRKLVGKSEELTKNFVDEMNSNEHPELVVNLGDSIEDVKSKEGDALYFKKAIGLLAALNMPVYHLIGNHDIKTFTDKEIAGFLGYDRMYYSFDNGHFHFIVLSFKQIENSNGGIDRVVDKEQVNWLAKDLAETKKPTIVFSHYGLADDDMVGNFWFEKNPEKAVIKNRLAIRKMFEGSGKVKAVISGHQHWNRMIIHNGIPYITVTSLVENFKNDGVPAEAYTIVNVSSKGINVEVKGNDPAKYDFKFSKYPWLEFIRVSLWRA